MDSSTLLIYADHDPYLRQILLSVREYENSSPHFKDSGNLGRHTHVALRMCAILSERVFQIIDETTASAAFKWI